MELSETFSRVYEAVDGYKIYNAGKRDMNDADTANLIYGEIPFHSMQEIFNIVKSKLDKCRIFYDLGSGAGRILVCAALLCPKLQKIVGVELVPALNEAAHIAQSVLMKVNSESA